MMAGAMMMAAGSSHTHLNTVYVRIMTAGMVKQSSRATEVTLVY